jgi:hypothetical protein
MTTQGCRSSSFVFLHNLPLVCTSQSNASEERPDSNRHSRLQHRHRSNKIIRIRSLLDPANFSPQLIPAPTPTSTMCVTIYGRRQCAICGFIPDELVHMPYDRRSRVCEFQGFQHQQRTQYNNSPFVCACCIELIHTGLERGLMIIRGTDLNPEAEEFLPWWVWKGKNLGWVGGYWYFE